MGVMPYPTMYSYPFPVLSTSPPAAAPAPAPAAPAGPSEEDKFKTLQALLISQEADRVARENERFAVAEAKLAKELADKLAAEALAAATKKAKEDAEAEAGQKAKDAAEKHKKALDEAKAATETAKKGEEEAKAEAEKHKPGDDAGKGPIRFKDAVGRKFCFPWAVCKTWKVPSSSTFECELPTNPELGHGRADQTSIPPRRRNWAARARRSLRPHGARRRNRPPSGVGTNGIARLVDHNAHVADAGAS